MKKFIITLVAIAMSPAFVFADVEPGVFTLNNGMKFILLPRAEEPNSVAVGWVAKVGSVNERPGITGMSHFFEHLMFKGTDTIGTTDAIKDAAFTNEERVLRNQMLEIIWGDQYERFLLGEIDDPWDVKNDTPQLAALRKELKSAIEAHRGVIVKDEFFSIFQSEGANGINAFTSEDVTFYINQLPANKFELWCWMESDRLKNSVFREFFSERDVVHEERRMRTDSSPTGVFQEQFNSMFWQASPYSWPVIGWPSDLNSYTLEEARRYFDVYYQPGNLVGVVVGDFDLESAKSLILEYFGSLEPNSVEPPPVPTIEPMQRAPQRMVADVDAQSQIEVRYHGVPFQHKDSYALEIMSSVLNGKTGRLYKALVEGKEVASSANFGVDAKKYAGVLSFKAAVKGDAAPGELESAWYEQVALLQSEPVSSYELEKVKNNVVADQFRKLQSNFYLMIQLGYAEAIGGWEAINESKDFLLAVNTEDIMRVANTYLITTNSSVAEYHRSKDAPAVDDELSAFSPEEQMMIKQVMGQFNTIPENKLVEEMEKMRQMSQQVPPELKPIFDYVLQKLQERISTAPPSDGGVEAFLETTNKGGVTKEVEKTDGGVTEEVEETDGGANFVEKKSRLELTPQQLAQATEFLANLPDVGLVEARQVEVALQLAATRVTGDELPVLEYILAKYIVHIAELENKSNP